MNNKINKGFTLIELMIVVVVIGVLAAIAMPSYQDYVKKARRSDGLNELLSLQLAQEKWRANNPAYTTNITGDLLFPDNLSPDEFYLMSISVSGATYTITADPRLAQAADSDCDPMTIDQDGEVLPADCRD